MEEIFTLKETVLWKGNQAQIERFQSEGKLYRTQIKALEIRLNEEYENVEMVGKGKNIEFVCINKRPKPINLVNARKGQPPSEMALVLEKLLAMKMIENNYNHEGCFHFPVNRLMEEFEIADKRFCYYERNKTYQNKELETVDIHREITEDVYNNLHSNFSNAIFRALKELKKKGLAKWYMLPYAKYYRTEVVKTSEDDALEIDGEVKIMTTDEWYAPLDVKIAKEIDDKIKFLEERLSINYRIAKNRNHPNSDEFIQEYKEIHAFHGIRFKYDAYCSYL